MALTRVSTPAIKDEAITLAKLLHGDSNSNGKFLRANNGADPTFETIDLTALSASNLTSGTIPDARFPSALPAIDGSALTGITSVNISGNADNRVITGSDTANTLSAEAGFTHNPATDDTQIITSNNLNVADLLVQHTGGGAGAVARFTLHGGSNANSGCQLGLIVGSHAWYLETPKNAGNLNFMKGSQKFRMGDDGNFTINDGDLVVANGHGIDFSATGNAGNNASMSNELFDDYEEGTWTPFFYAWIGGGSPATHDTQIGRYTKVGNLVHITYDLKGDRGNMAHNYITIGGLPFTYSSSNKGWAAIPWTEYVGSENSTSSTRGHGLQFGGGATAHAWLTGYTTGANGSGYTATYLDTNYMSNTNHTRIRGSATYFTNQ